jgi:hypothetical protein
MKHARRSIAALRVLLVAVGCLWLAGCGTSLNKVVRADTTDPMGYIEVRDGYAGLVSVYRDGGPLPLRIPLSLRGGDEIETGPDAGAVIRFEDGGEVVLGPRTRVRLGSLEVLFGRIFASVRGLFSAESETVVAGVEGTRFLFAVDRGQDVQVAVLEGRVLCTSRTDAWEPIHLGPGHSMTTLYPHTVQPQIAQMSRGQIAEIERWAEGIRQAPRAGYCCLGGKVFEAHSNACRGHFEETERAARYQCQAGWCCSGGQVTRGIRAECRGSFHLDQGAAERACAAPPPPPPQQGWCCLNGKVTAMGKDACTQRSGRFYPSQHSAEAACQRPRYDPQAPREPVPPRRDEPDRLPVQ